LYPKEKIMQRKKMLTGCVLTLLFLGVGARLLHNKESLAREALESTRTLERFPVRVEEARYARLEERLVLDGRFKAREEVTLYARGTGYVRKKFKRAGAALQAGDCIAELDQSLTLELLVLARQDVEKSAADVRRFRALLVTGASSRSQYEEEFQRFREARKTVLNLEEDLKNSRLLSPISGILDKDYFEEGTLLSVGAAVADLVNISRLKLQARVTGPQRLRLQPGQEAEIRVEALPGRVWRGRIEVMEENGNENSYGVDIGLEGEAESLLKPGLYARAYITLQAEGGGEAGSLAVPRRAIAGGFQEPYVFVLREGRARRQPVRIGFRNSELVEVLAGVSAGEEVVTAGQINLRDGAEVRVLR
jgi:RND family efflux transporter MFP subunit